MCIKLLVVVYSACLHAGRLYQWQVVIVWWDVCCMVVLTLRHTTLHTFVWVYY